MLMATALICNTSWGGEFFKLVKQQRAETRMVVDGFLYVDAEDFDDYGGWRMDTQFVHLMGSAFMMATGIGNPVQDATTTIDVPKAGDYHVWVRARNWVKDHAPGRFEVLVDGKALVKEFGAADTEAWTWEKGGAVTLKKGEVKLALHDLTGFYGRCDAVLLTTDAGYVPPEDKDAVCRERARLQGISLEPTFAGEFDVIVVGAGSAGVPAAIAAARNGAKTALIQNRPTLGGNCSVEAGVGVNGAGGDHPGWREAGIIEEAGWVTANEKQINYSKAFMQLCEAEENLTVFLNQHVFDAIMDGKKRIKGVRSVSTLTGLISEYRGTMYVDCSGDGWLGYYAGAEYRHGREASSEFNEKLAPKQADKITMSGCIMGDGNGYMTAFRSQKTDRPVDFALPPWVKPIETLNGPGRQLRGVPGTGTWWMEHPGDIDDAMQAEEARDELIKVTLAFWDYVKNRSRFVEQAKAHTLVTIPILDAKRESRRLVGDYMVNQNDVQAGRLFPDRIAYSGWKLDIHHPRGIYSGKEGSFDFMIKVPLSSVPYRSIYSKNIENLLMAGRCLSYSHVALGTVRVQSTLATVGQAAGTAAAMCVDRSIDPRTLGQQRIAELQQELLKDDQTIQGLKNEDPADLARQASVTASSYDDNVEDAGIAILRRIPLNMDRSVMIPVEGGKTINSVSVYLESKAAKAQTVKIRVAGLKVFGAFDTAEAVGEYTANIPAKTKGWIDVPVNATLSGNVRFLQIALPEVPGVEWPTMATGQMPGGRSYNETTVAGEFYAVRTDPPTVPQPESRTFEPGNVINGWTRLAENPASMWRSDPAQRLPQWVELDFGKPTAFNTVQLTFVTNPNGHRPKLPFSPTCARAYDLDVLVDGEWVRVIRERDSFQRHRVHSFVTQTATKLRVTVSATHGAQSASLFEVRVYNERQMKTTGGPTAYGMENDDLVTPVMTDDAPAPGKRVRQVAPEYKGTEVYHTLYLPSNWVKGETYPVIVEYTGNKWKFGPGTIDVANLGYGMSGGEDYIWVTMPYVEKGRKQNAVTWWGDRQATIDYCKVNLPRICKQWGGDPERVIVCGFSRGAIATSYIGLADDHIASLWSGVFTFDHFDGHKRWGYPDDERAAALKRLARLKGRPVLVGGQNPVKEGYLEAHLALADFTFLQVPTGTIFKIPGGAIQSTHIDMWLHRDSPYRRQVRAWMSNALGAKEEQG